jgi:hypothetical protein
MGINIYNDEEKKYSKLIEDLKELPEVKAPDNFEFLLMTRIQNKNFENEKALKEPFNFIKFFAPSAVVVSIIILFFIFLPGNDTQYENPLMSDPSQIASQIDHKNNSDGDVNNQKVSERNNITESKEPLSSRSYNVTVNPNDAVIKQSEKYPIFRNRSVALDDYISGESSKRNSLQRGNVVKSGDDASEFDGFFIREEPDQKTIEKYRLMLDSVKRAQAKADSLKRAKKAE